MLRIAHDVGEKACDEDCAGQLLQKATPLRDPAVHTSRVAFCPRWTVRTRDSLGKLSKMLKKPI